jgi:hypothetical protein
MAVPGRDVRLVLDHRDAGEVREVDLAAELPPRGVPPDPTDLVVADADALPPESAHLSF